MAGRDPARTQGVVDSIAAAGGAAVAWLGELTAPDACDQLIAACRERFGRLDLLVNSAGVFHPALAEEPPEARGGAAVRRPAPAAAAAATAGAGGKVGRNDPCPCGSGKKFKKCCGS